MKYFQNYYLYVGFGCAIAGMGTCSNCPVLIYILELCRTVLFPWSCWCSCVCLLKRCDTWSIPAARGVPGCSCSWLWHSSKARLTFPGDVVKKGGLVEYTGNNVNIFYYYGVSRTMKMWLLYNYNSLGIQLFYFVTCGYKTQKMQCNQMVNMYMCAECGKSSSEGTAGEWSLKTDAQIVDILAKFLIVHFNLFCISCSCKVHLSYFWRLSTCTILY